MRGFGLDRRQSEFALDDVRPLMLPNEETETTFVLHVPARELSDDAESPLDNGTNALTEGFEEAETYEEVPQYEGGNNSVLPSMLINVEGSPRTMNSTVQDLEAEPVSPQRSRGLRKKRLKLSKHGIQYPSLPPSVIKKLATSFAKTAGHHKTKLGGDTLDAIIQASDWFFEQISDDLYAYSRHAGRQTIDETDIVALMARYVRNPGLKQFTIIMTPYRQRQTSCTVTPFSLAQRYLPRELLQEMRISAPSNRVVKRRLRAIDEEPGDDSVYPKK